MAAVPARDCDVRGFRIFAFAPLSVAHNGNKNDDDPTFSATWPMRRQVARAAFAADFSLPRFFLFSALALGSLSTMCAVAFFAMSARRVGFEHMPSARNALYTTLLRLSPSSVFSELMPLGSCFPSSSPVPVSRLSFVISSRPANSWMLSEYLRWWNSGMGSQLIRATSQSAHCTIFWGPTDEGKIPNHLNVRRSNQTNYHWKWATMAYSAIRTDPPEIDWFILLDDDTLPFVDNVARFLGTFPEPRRNYYFVHGPGERRSGNRLGNGGGGFYLSRKLVEDSGRAVGSCIRGMARHVLNGDIRLDTCLRRFLNRHPQFVNAMFHLDPKVLKGDLTGFVEGFITKVGLIALHHIDKWHFEVFPSAYITKLTKGEPLRTQMRFFIESAGILGKNFLTRHILLFQRRFVVLNEGYSVVFFPDDHIFSVMTYLTGVEETFTATKLTLYDELLDLLVPCNNQVTRYYLKNITHVKGAIQQFYALPENPLVTVAVTRRGATVTLNPT